MILPKNRFWKLIIFSIIFGLILQQIFVWTGPSKLRGFNYIGFGLLIPLALLLFIGFLQITKLKNKGLILTISALLFIGVFILNTAIASITFGPSSEMINLGPFVIGLLASLLIGIFYGNYLSNNLSKE